MAEEVASALESAAKLAAVKGLTRFTRFLDPAQLQEAVRIAKNYGTGFDYWGGYEQAERAVACFHPQDEIPAREDYPIACLHTRYVAKFCSLSHRDLLGAFMALGLTRACIGDILIEDEDIYLFVAEQVSGFIAQALTTAGKVPLHFEELDVIPPMPPPKGVSYGAVVSSLRLDAVLAAAYHLSRGGAAEAIHAGFVKLNHLPCVQTDTAVGEGALLSLRSRGRVRLVSIDGRTRKQRIGVTFFRYE